MMKNKKAVVLGVTGLLGLGALGLNGPVDLEAFEIEKIGDGDFVMPNNPVTLDDAFWNKYLSTADREKLFSLLKKEEVTNITSEKQLADLVAEKLSSGSIGYVVSETINLNDGYKLSFDKDGNIANITLPNGGYGNINEVYKVMTELSINEKPGDLLEKHGKQERAMYFRSSASLSLIYNEEANTLTFKSTVILYNAETISEIKSRDLLVDSMVKMINEAAPNATDKEKAYLIYNYLTRFVTYDVTSNTSAHTGGSLALDYRAVCQSIAYIYNAVGQKLGLDIHYLAGTAGGENHAWNAIKLDGQWYYTDATWGTYKNAKSNMDKNDGYTSYNEYFLFSAKKNERVPTEASQEFLNKNNVVLDDTRYDNMVSFSNLGAGQYKQNMVMYTQDSLKIVDKDTLEVKKELEMSKINYSYSKSAVVNNEFYQVYRGILEPYGLLVVVTDLETLETRTFEEIPYAKALAFVSNGILIQDTTTNQLKVLLYSTNQKKQATDKVFQIAASKSDMYYVSDKALVDYNINVDAITQRLESMNTSTTKDYSLPNSYETVNLTDKKEEVVEPFELEVRNFNVETKEESELFIGLEYGTIDKTKLKGEEIKFILQSDNLEATKTYTLDLLMRNGQRVSKDVTGQQLMDGLDLDKFVGKSSLMKDKVSNTMDSFTIKILDDKVQTVQGYVTVQFEDETINEKTFNVKTVDKTVTNDVRSYELPITNSVKVSSILLDAIDTLKFSTDASSKDEFHVYVDDVFYGKYSATELNELNLDVTTASTVEVKVIPAFYQISEVVDTSKTIDVKGVNELVLSTTLSNEETFKVMVDGVKKGIYTIDELNALVLTLSNNESVTIEVIQKEVVTPDPEVTEPEITEPETPVVPDPEPLPVELVQDVTTTVTVDVKNVDLLKITTSLNNEETFIIYFDDKPIGQFTAEDFKDLVLNVEKNETVKIEVIEKEIVTPDPEVTEPEVTEPEPETPVVTDPEPETPVVPEPVKVEQLVTASITIDVENIDVLDLDTELNNEETFKVIVDGIEKGVYTIAELNALEDLIVTDSKSVTIEVIQKEVVTPDPEVTEPEPETPVVTDPEPETPELVVLDENVTITKTIDVKNVDKLNLSTDLLDGQTFKVIIDGIVKGIYTIDELNALEDLIVTDNETVTIEVISKIVEVIPDPEVTNPEDKDPEDKDPEVTDPEDEIDESDPLELVTLEAVITDTQTIDVKGKDKLNLSTTLKDGQTFKVIIDGIEKGVYTIDELNALEDLVVTDNETVKIEVIKKATTTPGGGGSIGGGNPGSGGSTGGGNPGGSTGGGSTIVENPTELPSTDVDDDEIDDSTPLELDFISKWKSISDSYLKFGTKQPVSNLTNLRQLTYAIEDLMEEINKLDDTAKAEVLKDLDVNSAMMNVIIQLLGDENYNKDKVVQNENLRSHYNMTYVYLNRILKALELDSNETLVKEIKKYKIEYIKQNVWNDVKFK